MNLKLASEDTINISCEISFDLMEEQYYMLSFVQELLILKQFKSKSIFLGQSSTQNVWGFQTS